MPWAGEWTPLDSVEAGFREMEARSGPFALDVEGIGVRCGDHSGKQAPLRELRAEIMQRGTPYAVREEVWMELVFQVQSEGGDWPLAAVWMMAPGLRGAAARVVRTGRVPYPDMEAEVIEGFLTELPAIDIDAGAVASRLWWAGYRNGLRAKAAYTGGLRTTPLIEQWELHARGATFATGHPDFVLGRAVRAGAVTADEAELIGRTRMEDEGLADAARRLGIGYTACRVRRAVAEERLARYLLVPGPESGPGRPHQPSIGDLADLADPTDLAEAA